MTNVLALWTIYDHPRDRPGGVYIARKWLIDSDGEVATAETLEASTLEELRDKLPPGLTRLARDPADDPVIVEVWL